MCLSALLAMVRGAAADLPRPDPKRGRHRAA